MSNGVIKSLRLVDDHLAKENINFTETRLNTDFAELARLDAALKSVRGQDYACQAVKEYLFGIKHKQNEKGPWGMLMFAGAPATGKTYMAEHIAEAMGLPHLRLDMSNFSDKESYCDMFGLNPSYKASEPGYLTKYVSQNPVAVVILDEIEKCHPNVMNRLLQVFERGEIEDLCLKQTVSFSDVIFIMTSNICKRIYDGSANTYNFSGVSQNVILNAMRSEDDPITGKKFFSEAFVSRIASGRVILFNKLSPEVLRGIAAAELRKNEEKYGKLYRLSFSGDIDLLADIIVLNQGRRADARSVQKGAAEFYEKNIERLVTYAHEKSSGMFSSVRLSVGEDSFTDKSRRLFKSEIKHRILVYGDTSISEHVPPEMKNKLELIAASDDFDVKSIAELDVSAAILDVSDGAGAVRDIFSMAVLNEVPTYVYDITGAMPTDMLYFTDNGASGSFLSAAGEDFGAWIADIVNGLELSYMTRELFRSNKIVSFDTSYAIDAKLRRGIINLNNIDIMTAVTAEDSEDICSECSIPNVTFDDVICPDELKGELNIVVDSLVNYKKYKRLGRRIPRGYLLDGDPGTGKTMLAKAIANAAKLPFIQKNAAEFLRELVGQGAKELRNVFATARRYSPCILFIDEIDCIAAPRTGVNRRAEITQDITDTFLSEMDGFAANDSTPVFVIAATNFNTGKDRPELDRAFLRRFDRRIHIDLPKYEDRRKYIAAELGRYKNTVSEKCKDSIARRSIGWSLADLDLVIQNALRSVRERELSDTELEEAFISFTDGYKKDMSEEDIRRAAIHEAGHVAASVLTGVCPLYATIVSRGNYGGFVMYGDEDKITYTKAELLNNICVSLAGRAAELVVYGDTGMNTGASDDIKKATELATRMVCDYGMDDGLFMYIPRERAGNSSTAGRISAIMSEQAGRAQKLMSDNTALVGRIADALIAKNSLDESELKKLTEDADNE